MTTEKPPVPSDDELGRIDNYAANYIMGRRALWLAGYHARDAEVKRLRDTVESLDILRERAQLRGSATYGAYARNDARIAELEADERETQRQLDNERINHEATAKYCVELQNRVTELDAEVAELRASQAQVRKLVTEYSHHISPAIRETLSAKVSAVASRSSLPDGAICTVCGCEKRDHELPLRSSSCFAFTVLPAAPRRTPELTERVALELSCQHDDDELYDRTRRILDLVFGKERE